jgi:hypothetical protein
VAPAQEEGAASGEFKQGLEEGIALGVKIGLKEGLTEATDLKGELIRKEAAHIMAAGGASVERRFVEKVQGKYEKAEHALREVQAWETGPGDSEGAVPTRALARKAGAQGQQEPWVRGVRAHAAWASGDVNQKVSTNPIRFGSSALRFQVGISTGLGLKAMKSMSLFVSSRA